VKVEVPYNCGLGPALSVISGKWKGVLLWELHAGPVRYGRLKRRVPGISEKVLIQQSGAELNAAVLALAEWGARHVPKSGEMTCGAR
jgi:DNA-binding HxlR family transcriptional regulator